MLPSASGSVAHSGHTQHDHTSSRFRDIILAQESLREQSPPIEAEQGIYSQNEQEGNCQMIYSQQKPY